jgi:uncharacterized protein YfaS (alpha-2-macroglobulin family)
VGVLQTTFYTTVFDETGRPVSRASSIDVFTQDVFFGIKYDGWYYHALNQPVQFALASVNKDGKAVNAKARIEIIKREYNTHLVNSGGIFPLRITGRNKIYRNKRTGGWCCYFLFFCAKDSRSL